MQNIQNNNLLVPTGSVFIKCVHSPNKCFDVNEGSTTTGAKIIQYEQHFGDNQKFVLERVIESNYSLNNVFYVRCLQSSLYWTIEKESTQDCAFLVQNILKPLKDNHCQRFIFENLGNGKVMIQSFHSKKYLDITSSSQNNCAQVIQIYQHGGQNQQFIIQQS